jgi:hypothetical protein
MKLRSPPPGGLQGGDDLQWYLREAGAGRPGGRYTNRKTKWPFIQNSAAVSKEQPAEDFFTPHPPDRCVPPSWLEPSEYQRTTTPVTGFADVFKVFCLWAMYKIKDTFFSKEKALPHS